MKVRSSLSTSASLADEEVMICPRQVYDAHAARRVLKIFLPPIDVGHSGVVEGLDGGTLLRVLGLILGLLTLGGEKRQDGYSDLGIVPLQGAVTDGLMDGRSRRRVLTH